jgi:hypothetical protein
MGDAPRSAAERFPDFAGSCGSMTKATERSSGSHTHTHPAEALSHEPAVSSRLKSRGTARRSGEPAESSVL